MPKPQLPEMSDVLLELPIPENVQPKIPATRNKAAGLSTSLRISSLREALRNRPIPQLPSFHAQGDPIPLITVERVSAEWQVRASTYIRCGRVPTKELDEADPAIPHNPNFHVDSVEQSFQASGTGVSGGGIGSSIGVSRLPGHGAGVLVAIVDGGVNAGAARNQPANCGSSGLPDCFDVQYSVGSAPGTGNNAHGAMVAYDVTIAAPDVTLSDVTVPFESSTICGYASAYSGMMELIFDKDLFGKYPRGYVAVNSWQIVDPTRPDVATFITNKHHPVNRLIASLGDLGVDVVFAAGNCGILPFHDCPVDNRIIYGANSLASVFTVGAAHREDNLPADYSGHGPGFVDNVDKPDVLAYADFPGSHAYGANHLDSNTSAAAPLAAGILASLRSTIPIDLNDPSTLPEALRQQMRLATRLANGSCNTGRDPQHDETWGYGIVTADCLKGRLSGSAMIKSLRK